MERLETRCLLAGVWDGGGATDDWNDPLNWDDNALPTAADNVVIGAAFAADTITSSNDVTINSLITEASLAISGGVFTVSAGATFNNTLTLSGTANLTLGGTSAINDALTTGTGTTIRVQADGSVGAATLTVANSFTNNGAIELTAINGSGETATLNVSSGTLTNSATGSIQSLAGTGGARNLNAQLNNQGLIAVNQALTINKASADHTNSGVISVSGGDLLVTQSGDTPTFTNSSTGTFTIASSRTLNLSGGSFTNFSGGTLTDGIYNVAGTFKFDNAAITTNAATIVLDGASSQIVNQSNSNALSGFNNNAAGGNFTIKNGRNYATPSTFTNAGNLTVESPSVFSTTSGTFNFNGGMVSGEPQIIASTLNMGVSATGAATFSIRSSSVLTGDIAAGQTILIQGDNSFGAATLTAANGFSNAGTITLESVAGSGSSSNLTVNNGTLTIASTGVLNSNTGGGGSRIVAANLTNNGTVNLNESTTFSKSSGSYTNNNAFNIASDKTLTINGSGQVFTQAGGTLTATGLFDLTSAVFNFNGGTISGTPRITASTLNIGNGSTGAGTFSIRSSSNFSGDIAAGQTILIQGDNNSGAATLTASNDVTNAGTITLESVSGSSSSSNLTVSSGTLTNAETGVINVNTGTGGTRTISANLINNGTVNLNESTTFSKSSGSYTNNGDFNLADGETLNINGSSQTFHQNGGTLDLLGTTALFDMTSATFNFNGGTVSGTPRLTASTLNIGNGSTGAATFSIRSSSNFSGNVAAGQTILVQGDNSNGAATLTAADSFTNSGNITLQSVAGSASNSNLTVNSGTLTNVSGGVIDVNAGGGGSRTIAANLTNSGTVNLNTSTTFSKSSGSYTNNNAFNLASGQTLTINGSGQVFTQAGGTLSATGLFDMTSAVFNFNGGTVTGTPKLNASTLNIGNGSTGAATFSMRSSSNLTGDVAAAQTILVQGDGSFGSATLTAANGFINAGTITLESVAGSGSSSNLTVNSGTLTSSGTINFNAGGGGSRTLTTELANSGIVNVNTSATLGRSGADHTNSGTINVTGGDLTVSQSGTTPTFANSGSGIINIADTRTLNISGGELSNFSGGTLAGGTFNVTGKLQFPGAAITTNAATIVLDGANSQIVNESNANGLTNFATNTAAGSFTIQNGRDFTTAAGIAEFANVGNMTIATGTTFTVSNGKKYSQTGGTTTLNGVLVTTHSTGVDIQGGILQGSGDIAGHLRNAGQVNAGTSPGSLDVSGNYTQAADGVLNIEIGGTTAVTQFDQINITGSATLDGTLNVSLINSFVPDVADSFQVMTFASHTGDFATKNGLDISSSLNFDPQFNASGYLLDVNGWPVFTSSASPEVAENSTAVTTVTTTDPDVPAQTVTFSIVGGADAAKFQIVAETGVLSFVAAPDFEAPTDMGTNNIYDVTVQANDGHGGLTTQDIAVMVTPVNDNSPAFTSAAAVDVAENSTAVLTVTATDADLPGQMVTFSITGGADQSKFNITSSGVLAFQTAPDFENPTDDGTNNVYNVQVTADDGNGLTTVQNIAVTVTAVNDNNPVFTSAAAVDVDENETAVLTVTATDADLPTQSVTFSLVGGADQSKFSITSEGVLTFQTAPDFENPTDDGADNIYNVTVQASDGNGGTTTQDIAVTITPVAENAPIFTSPSAVDVAENSTAVLTVTATDADLPAQTITFSIFGGVDAAKFSITPEGVLTFQAAPDFENPTDVGANNVYNVIVRADDGNNSVTDQSIAVTVTPVNDNSPVFTSAATANVATGTTAVRTVTATDADQPAQTITFSITGGADQSKFSITSGGVLTFQAAPDFFNPTDSNTDNVYEVQVTSDDNSGRTTTQNIAVTVVDINVPEFTSNATAEVVENSTAVLTVIATDADVPAQTISFSIVAGADSAKFSITNEGVLTFLTAPDFENPTDADTNNVYLVTVQADDGNGGLATQDIAVTVTSINDNNPVFTSAATVNVAENSTAVGTVTATDADLPAQSLTFSITGGADQSQFSITSGGVLTFQTAPDFEVPTDVGTNNIYNVQVTASDGNGLTTTQDIAVTVTPVNDNNPVFTSAMTANVAENSTAVLTVTATDADLPGQSLTFSIVGGADQAKFSITSGGMLTFQAAPDFENPTDAGTNNVYNVTVQADDGNGGLTTQDIAVTVMPVNDNSPVFTSSTTFNVAENTTAVGTVVATDADLPGQTVTYSLSGGTDQAKFSITSGGVLTFQAAPDFENPNDTGTNNIYNVQVTASDGNGLTTTQDIAVTVTPVNDNSPVFTSATTANVPENSTAVLTVTATDADQPAQSLTFSLVGGADQSKFSITGGGVLTFQSAPDFESPTDNGTNNVYNVTVQADDGNGRTTTQNIAVTVTPVNDNNPVFTSATSFDVAENSTAIGTVSATDADFPVQSLTFSVTGGADQSKFSITSGGVLTFSAVHDFENPNDVGNNNVYNVQVTASDGNGGTTTQDISVTVTNLAPSAPIDGTPAGSTIVVNSPNGTQVGITAFSSDPAGGAVTYSLTNDAEGRFTINSTTGVVTVANSELVDSPAIYTITVQASDGELTASADFTINVTNVSADFGDAPASAQSGFANSYPTSLSNNGAFHAPTGPTFGATRDVEFDGQPNLAASGDDSTGGTDDEDGITFLTSFETGRATAIRVNVQNAAVTGNFLDAWIDWNRDGDWDDAGEQISAGQALVNGDNAITIMVPSDASIGDTYARFRLSTTGGLAPTGEATDGEVEDYKITVAAASGVSVLQLVSRAPQTSISQTGGGLISSGGRTVSDDGRYVVFVSNTILVPEDTNNQFDVYRMDRLTGEIRLVSVNPSGTSPRTGPSLNPTISADGSIVAFESLASDLIANDTNGSRSDVFVRNLITNTTTLVSVNRTNSGTGNGECRDPILSADGNVVGFLSTSSNLVPNDTNGFQDLFVRNLSTNTTSLVGINRTNNDSGNGETSGKFALSADGHIIAFESRATNLIALNDGNGAGRDVFVRNLTTNTTTFVSVDFTGTNSATNESFGPSISADGQVVSFASLASNLVNTLDFNASGADVFARNLTTNVTTLVTRNSSGTGTANFPTAIHAISADGSSVVFESRASDLISGDANGVNDVFVRNLNTNVTTLVSVNSAGTASGNERSFAPVLSANGQFVAFRSLASNLTSNDSNGSVSDVFVRNLSGNTTTLVSASPSGSGNGASALNNGISISANGRTVAFDSIATNLVSGDRNGAEDAFAFAIPASESAPSAPLDVNVAPNSVVENAATGTIVGVTAFATDPESADVTYSLINSAGGRFAINPSTGVVTVANGGLLDFETATVHAITVQASDGANVSAAQFTIAVSNSTADQDQDGVPQDEENAGPNNGDGNNDGIPDSQQINVATLPNTNGQFVTLASPDGTTLVGVTATQNPSPSDAPAVADFSAGFLDFQLDGLSSGSATTVSLILPKGSFPKSYWKFGPTADNTAPHWYEFLFDGTTGAVINGNVITLHFVDGQRGDSDLTANGVIVDPGAPAFEPFQSAVFDLSALNAKARLQVNADSSHVELVNAASGALLLDLTENGITQLTVNGDRGSNTLTVDYSNGDPLPADGLFFNADRHKKRDELVILGAEEFESVQHSFTNRTDGVIDLDGKTIAYTGLERILDQSAAAQREFQFSEQNDRIVLQDAERARNGLLKLSNGSKSVPVIFASPAESLRLLAGDGNDRVHIKKLDPTFSASASILVAGEAGRDSLKIAAAIGSIVLDGGTDADRLYGNSKEDVLLGGDGDDSLYGGAGHDLLIGGLGNDRLYGESGTDTLLGGDGNDTLRGGSNSDTVIGGFGNDSLYGDSGTDLGLGGQGGPARGGSSEQDAADRLHSSIEVIDEAFATVFAFE